MRNALLAMCGFLCSTAAALASGGISCSQTEGPHSVEINAAVTRGMGSPVYDLTGSVEAVDAAAPADLAKTEYSREHLAQYWLDGQDLRMVLYRERGPEAPHGYAELTIRAKADEEDGYSGDWELSIFDGTGDQPEGKSWMFGGKVNCTVE